jgi:hypothetical protein
VCVLQSGPHALPRGLSVDALEANRALTTVAGRGLGMAVCTTLGLLVVSCIGEDEDSEEDSEEMFPLCGYLAVFALPGPGEGSAGAGLTRVCTLGDTPSRAPMLFGFEDAVGYSGYLVFVGPVTSRLLVVTDVGHDAVHVIDVAGRVHVGYVAAPGTITGPRCVAARGSLVAVSTWKKACSGPHVVRVFEGSGAMWTAVRVVAGGFGGPGRADGQLNRPYGLRFTGDGTGLAVADWGNGRVSVFRVEDGSFVRHVATGLSYPRDVEECEGGWLVACDGTDSIEFVGGDVGGGGVVRARLGMFGHGDGEPMSPSALALVPGLGLVVREWASSRLQVFS